jgi:hypothetical protein
VAGSLNITLAVAVAEEGEGPEVPLHATTSRPARTAPDIKKIGQRVPMDVVRACFAVTAFLPRRLRTHAIEEKQEIARE